MLLPLTQVQAHIGTAAIPHHNRQCQGHDRQGKHHRVGSIAPGPQIISVGNVYLIHNVVKCSHQQRNHTGQSILPHQGGYGSFFQKYILFCFHTILLQ